MDTIIEPRFKELFQIAPATALYTGLLESVPQQFVGSPTKLALLAELLSAESVTAFKEGGWTLPPWRKISSMLAKWGLNVPSQVAKVYILHFHSEPCQRTSHSMHFEIATVEAEICQEIQTRIETVTPFHDNQPRRHCLHDALDAHRAVGYPVNEQQKSGHLSHAHAHVVSELGRIISGRGRLSFSGTFRFGVSNVSVQDSVYLFEVCCCCPRNGASDRPMAAPSQGRPSCPCCPLSLPTPFSTTHRQRQQQQQEQALPYHLLPGRLLAMRAKTIQLVGAGAVISSSKHQQALSRNFFSVGACGVSPLQDLAQIHQPANQHHMQRISSRIPLVILPAMKISSSSISSSRGSNQLHQILDAHQQGRLPARHNRQSKPDFAAHQTRQTGPHPTIRNLHLSRSLQGTWPRPLHNSSSSSSKVRPSIRLRPGRISYSL